MSKRLVRWDHRLQRQNILEKFEVGGILLLPQVHVAKTIGSSYEELTAGIIWFSLFLLIVFITRGVASTR